MTDDQITASLAEVHAAWLMDPDDEACQSLALRHLVDAAVAAERERCAKLCEAKAKARWAWWDSRADPADQGAAMVADELADEIRRA